MEFISLVLKNLLLYQACRKVFVCTVVPMPILYACHMEAWHENGFVHVSNFGSSMLKVSGKIFVKGALVAPLASRENSLAL